jgi:hypothetical protein
MTKTAVVITAALVDEFAQVRDQLKALTAREKYLKEIFREPGAAIYKGRNHQIEISFTYENRLDMTAARAKLGAKWCAENVQEIEKISIRQMEIVK